MPSTLDTVPAIYILLMYPPEHFTTGSEPGVFRLVPLGLIYPDFFATLLQAAEANIMYNTAVKVPGAGRPCCHGDAILFCFESLFSSFDRMWLRARMARSQ